MPRLSLNSQILLGCLFGFAGGLWLFAIGPTPANTCDDSKYAENAALQEKLVADGVLRDFGPMPDEEIGRYLQVADIAILPSRDEPQGMAMIEAMAAGLIVVSGNVGGIRESINHGVDGLLVMNCPTALADGAEVARAVAASVAATGATGDKAKPVLACWLGDAPV